MDEPVVVRRLDVNDVALARETLALMASVFDEPADPLSDTYVRSLLVRAEFWVLAALKHGAPIGGVTAHALPMTRNESSELFVYDLAVQPAHQRRGVGRKLIATLRAQAATQGITVAFVPADDEDDHALEFYRALGGAASDVTIFTFQ